MLLPEFCESGFELMGEDCVKCARGYYKNNTVRDLAKFDSCTKCDESVITPEEGAVSVDQCSQGENMDSVISQLHQSSSHSHLSVTASQQSLVSVNLLFISMIKVTVI